MQVMGPPPATRPARGTWRKGGVARPAKADAIDALTLCDAAHASDIARASEIARASDVAPRLRPARTPARDDST